ncbi:hypothetical protein Prudu_016203 [Prunus dulcis]|uniref:Uncharacterized protein n=1 Tax=Prunus dulcis TaxID=3755 RepID=A0A4Y1RKR8_PRUDU|nr:hypothetical protein Prudu_016203 [Prunus dulcis]
MYILQPTVSIRNKQSNSSVLNLRPNIRATTKNLQRVNRFTNKILHYEEAREMETARWWIPVHVYCLGAQNI